VAPPPHPPRPDRGRNAGVAFPCGGTRQATLGLARSCRSGQVRLGHPKSLVEGVRLTQAGNAPGGLAAQSPGSTADRNRAGDDLEDETHRVAGLAAENEQLSAELNRLRAYVAVLAARHEQELAAQTSADEQRRLEFQGQLALAQQRIIDLETSTSWRYTAGFRRMHAAFRRLRHQLARSQPGAASR
jgi:hypothetical protein